MDRATADAEGKPEDPAAVGPPSIGVPSIPARAVPVRPPVPVPSVTVPADTGPTGEEECGAATSEGPVTGRASPAPRAALDGTRPAVGARGVGGHLARPHRV